MFVYHWVTQQVVVDYWQLWQYFSALEIMYMRTLQNLMLLRRPSSAIMTLLTGLSSVVTARVAENTNPWLAVSPTDVTYLVRLNVVGPMLLALLSLNITICTALWFEQTNSVTLSLIILRPAWSICSQTFPFFNTNPTFYEILFKCVFESSFCPTVVRLPSWS